jgi:flavin reductase (DIM6/NTAB) family NADH-FMN oxidoreductase RutF
MPKQEAAYTEHLQETLKVMEDRGLLLVARDREGKPNTMAIGWATFGVMWGKPACMIMVRPSRYTYGLLVESEDFTVNVPPSSLAETVSFCGTVSGRNHDKFRERGLTAVPARTVRAPIIDECVIHYECRHLYWSDLDRSALDGEVDSACYPQGDHHRLFFAEIVCAYASEDARERV